MIPAAFINCVTRNFSIRRISGGQLFDEAFGYSNQPDSGFGWQDVEMGYRLYQEGARIKYLPDTASIHVSHPSTTDSRQQSLRSLRNFHRLHQRHADLLLVARQWSIRTYDAILDWARAANATLSESVDYQALEPRFRRYARSPVIIDRSRPLKILTYRWHCAHQYELYRLGHDVTLAQGLGTHATEVWDLAVRPLPRNARMVAADTIQPQHFDVAILHFDENVLHPERCGGTLWSDWGESFLRAVEEWDIPKVAVCHGTPQFHGQFDRSYGEPNLGETFEDSRRELVDLLSDVLVVCNSYQARHQWGFRNSMTIWYGFSPYEFPPGRHDRGILSMSRSALTRRPHYNGELIHDRTRDLLDGSMPISSLEVPDPVSAYDVKDQDWSIGKFQNYAATLGQ
jgi:hypothetical protein